MSELTEEQQEIIEAVRAVADRHATSADVREAFGGTAHTLWETLAGEIGAAAIAIPEEYDGVGFTSMESHLILETLGEYLAPTPFLSSAVVAAGALLAAADEDAKSRLLPAIASGETVATLAWATRAGTWNPTEVEINAADAGGQWTLTGVSPLVLDGAAANALLTIAQTADGPALFEIIGAETVSREPAAALDPTLNIATLTFSDTPARLLSADPTVLDHIRDTFLVALTALQVGAAARGLAMTVEYAGQRVQFGRPIGSFQALKHRMADMHVALETSRSISRAAARALAEGSEDLPRLAATAKAWCSDALNQIASETIQLHGGIAITWEHDAHIIFKRAHALDQLLGQASDQRSRLARILELQSS